MNIYIAFGVYRKESHSHLRVTPFERASFPVKKAHFKRCESRVMLLVREHMVCLSLTQPVNDIGEGVYHLSALPFLLKYTYRQRRVAVTMTGGLFLEVSDSQGYYPLDTGVMLYTNSVGERGCQKLLCCPFAPCFCPTFAY